MQTTSLRRKVFVCVSRLSQCYCLVHLIRQWWMVNKSIHVLHFQRFHSKFTKRWCQPKPLREIFPSRWRDRPSVQVELLPPYLSTWTINIYVRYGCSLCVSLAGDDHNIKGDRNREIKVCVPSLWDVLNRELELYKGLLYWLLDWLIESN